MNETKVDEVFIRKMGEYRLPQKGKGLLEQCSQSVVLFSEKMLGIKLYSWQVDFLSRINRAVHKDYWTNEFLAITSRQIGKSVAISIFGLWACVFNKYPGTIYNNTIVGVVSASDVQAKKLLRESKKLMHQGDRFMADTYIDEHGEPIFSKTFFENLISVDDPNNMTTISFKAYNAVIHKDYLLKDSKSGSMMISYPPTSVVLGETFTIVIEDEAGKTDRISDIFHDEYVYPTGNSTNAIRIYTSTPWVPSGFFYQLADPNEDFTEHSTDRVKFSIDAIKLENPDYYETVIKKITSMNADGKTDEVRRAYYCEFVKGEQVYFSPQKVFIAFNPEAVKLESYLGECDMGVDFGGQVTSRTAITISRLVGDNIQRLYHKTYEVGQDLHLMVDIAELLKRFNVQRIIPDDCPQGDYMIREMINKGWNVHPMNFRSDKTKKYGAFRAALNREEIQSYVDDELKTEMLALEFKEGTKQSLIQHAPGYTDDLIDSFVMSCYFFLVEDEGFKFWDLDDVPETEDEDWV